MKTTVAIVFVLVSLTLRAQHVGDNTYNYRLWQNNPKQQQNLVMELVAGYSKPINTNVDVFGSIGYIRGPVLSSASFLSRMPAPGVLLGYSNKRGPYNVQTMGALGVRYKIASVEGLVSTGNRTDDTGEDFNTITFNSYAYNFSVNPYKSLSFQFSQGITNLPKDVKPNIITTTATVQNVFRFSRNMYLASTIAYGVNTEKSEAEERRINQRSLLVQSDFNIKRFAVYGRFESIQRMFSQLMPLPGGSSNVSFTLSSISLGTSFRMCYIGPMDLRVGGHCTAALLPEGFNIFTGRTAFSGQFYIRMTPSLMSMYDVKKAGRDRLRMRSMASSL